MPIYQFNDDQPIIDPSAYIASSAYVIGKIKLGAHASIWFGATIRGDNEWISIGPHSNIQENCVLHTDMGYPLVIGAYVTVGHQATLHGCSVGDGALIGIGAVVLNGAKIGKNCLVGARALVTEGKEFPDNALIIGSPAKVVRLLTEQEIEGMQRNSATYVQRGQLFKTQLKQIG